MLFLSHRKSPWQRHSLLSYGSSIHFQNALSLQHRRHLAINNFELIVSKRACSLFPVPCSNSSLKLPQTVNITCKYIALNQLVSFYSNSGGEEQFKNQYKPFLARSVFLQRVEKIPSVQSFVATSSLPNIWGAVMALGFILISLCGVPQSVMAFINTWIHAVLPAPLGPSTIMPWRTLWVSNNCKGSGITSTLNLQENTTVAVERLTFSFSNKAN